MNVTILRKNHSAGNHRSGQRSSSNFIDSADQGMVLSKLVLKKAKRLNSLFFFKVCGFCLIYTFQNGLYATSLVRFIFLNKRKRSEAAE